MAVGGQHDASRLELGHPVERREELGERIGPASMPEMCGVIVGSTWSPESSTPSAGSNRHRWSAVWPGVCTTTHSRPAERDDLGVVDPHASAAASRTSGCHQRLAHAVLEPPCGGGRGSGTPTASPAPRRATRRGVRRASSSSASSSVGRVPPRAEGLVGDESAPASSPHRPAPPKWSGCEWVTTTVWTRLQPGRRPRRAGRRAPSTTRPGQAGVDDGDAALVLEGVAVDVAEAGHVDRQLHAQHARRDLGDLVGRGAAPAS